MRRILLGLALPVLLAVGLIIGSGAVTNAGGGISTTYRQGNTVTTQRVNPGIANLDGQIQLVATGETTKFLLDPTQTIALMNQKVTWSDAPAGANWTVTGRSIWNPSCCYNIDDVKAMDNAGGLIQIGALGPGQTWANGTDHVGGSTAKAQYADYSGTAWYYGCIYIATTAASTEGASTNSNALCNF